MSASEDSTETPPSEAPKLSLRRRLATSQSWQARLLRWGYYSFHGLSVPAPKVVVRPLLRIFLFTRTLYYFALRVFICEPYFKAFCTQYGRNVHTAARLHWITGKGDIVVGDNVSSALVLRRASPIIRRCGSGTIPSLAAVVPSPSES